MTHLTKAAAPGVAVVAALVLAGCGGGSSGGGGSTSGGSGSTAAASSSGTTTRSTSIGKVLATGSGRTIYELVGATAGHTTCTGACVSIWPKVMANGKQLVVHGHPAYTYIKDTAAGQVTGQGVKDQWGTWLALSPSGSPIPAHMSGTPAPSQSSSGSSGGGGGGGWG